MRRLPRAPVGKNRALVRRSYRLTGEATSRVVSRRMGCSARRVISRNYLITLIFPLGGMPRRVTIRASIRTKEHAMTKGTKATSTKTPKPEREANRYLRASRVIAKMGERPIDVKTLADRAFMSQSTAKRCLEAWHACVQALTESGRLPDPAKPAPTKAPPKPKPAAAETTGMAVATPTETTEAI